MTAAHVVTPEEEPLQLKCVWLITTMCRTQGEYLNGTHSLVLARIRGCRSFPMVSSRRQVL
jgi:hypothetical protein